MIRTMIAALLVVANAWAAEPAKELEQGAAAALSEVLPSRSQSKRPKLPKLEPSLAADDNSNAVFRVSFKLQDRELKASGNFVVESGTQANYSIGGDEPFEHQNAGGVGVEFKKVAAIINVLPAFVPGTDIVDCQWQSELSGPLAPKGSLKVQPISTFQLQTEFRVALGKTIVLVDEPDRRVEAVFTEIK